MSKIIAVFGATGSQGGSVLRALLNDQNYSIRAITRNPNSEKAKELAKIKNVSVHQADLDDPSSVDKVLQGCYGSFLVTDFSAHFEHKEAKQGISLIDSAIKNKVSHVVFSGLEHVQHIINKPCLHFDYKADIEDYGLKQSDKINFTSIRLPMYYQAIRSMLKTANNQSFLSLPISDKSAYAMDVEDIGECVKSIFDKPNEFKNKIVPVAGDKLNGNEIVQIINKYSPQTKYTYANLSLEKFASFAFPGVEDITNMFEYFQTEKMVRDIDLTKRLNKGVLTFEQWVQKNKDLFK